MNCKALCGVKEARHTSLCCDGPMDLRVQKRRDYRDRKRIRGWQGYRREGGRGTDYKGTCWGDENVLCRDCGIHWSKHTQLYTYYWWISLCISFTSKKLDFNKLVLK